MPQQAYKRTVRDLLSQAETLRHTAPQQALERVQAALEIAKTKHYTNGMAECLLLKRELELQAQCFPQVIEIAHEALETLKAIDASYLSAFHQLMGLAYWKQGDFKSAVVHGQQALSLATASKDKKAKLLAHQNLAHIYIYLDDYDEALSHLHLALSLAQELGAQEQLAIVHNYIGLIHWNQGKDELAMSEFEASIKIAETFDFQRHLHTALHNLGNVYARRGELHSNPDDLQKALCFFEKSLNIEETLKDDNAIALSHNNIGNVHRLLGSRQKALEHYHTALALSEKIGAKYTRIDVLINLGLFYIEEKNFTTAHLHLNEALALSESVQSNSQIVDILDALTQLYKSQGQFKEALETQERLNQVQRKIFNTNADARLKKLQLAMQIERYIHERNALEAELARKQSALQALTLTLTQNSQLIAELRDELIKLKNSPSSERSFDALLQKLNAHTSQNRDSQIFQQQFELLHPNFLTRLSQAFPQLTPTELKLCTLLKSNLSSKDIARLLNISVRSVESHRLSIRTKLRLKRKDNLVQFRLKGLDFVRPFLIS